MRISLSPFTIFARWGGFPLQLTRLSGNRAFSLFLLKIEYPSDENVNILFTCSKCEKFNSNGERVLIAVVLAGTATGILGKLPVFDRPKTRVYGADNTARPQYVLPHTNIRLFLNAFLSQMGRSSGSYFNVQLPALTTCKAVTELFFNESRDIRVAGFGLQMSTFLSDACFAPALKVALSNTSRRKDMNPVKVINKLKDSN